MQGVWEKGVLSGAGGGLRGVECCSRPGVGDGDDSLGVKVRGPSGVGDGDDG